MAAIQCKMCGGMVELPPGITSGECPYCGTLTTFPKVDDDRRENLYNRAEHFRRAGDFDKAVAAYESILNDDSSDPEAYWGIAISRFGIEYVEDPATRERIPTCHRVQYESFTSDPDYLSALEHSAGTAEHEIYEREGARIAEIQKNILKISAQEKPFDIFICYKESTDGGTRTKDSAIAQDIYYQLTNAGYKVFFARITLESKLGQQYEPYIFAALNSAKVMLVIGSKAEYFNAVWVKNEWSRFLALKKKDRSRLIIPCYRDMDPYDLPEELSLFQSQDMSKIGFIQDILHGIKKVLRREKEQPKSAESSGVTAKSNVLENLIRRIVMFIHDGDSKSAAEYCEKVLDQNMECGIVYYYKTLLECEVFSAADLILKDVDFTGSKNFRHALSFSTGEEKEKLDFLARAWKFMGSFESKSMSDLKTFSANCDKYLDANDAKILNRIIDKRIAEVNALEQIYNSGLAELEAKNYKNALEYFNRLPKDYKDSAKWQDFALNSVHYEYALALENEKKYKKAAEIFNALSGFADSAEHLFECKYQQALSRMMNGDFKVAILCFKEIKNYKDSNQRAAECRVQLVRQKEIEEEKKRKRKIRCVLVFFVSLISLLIFLAINASCEEQARKEAEEKARQERLAAEIARLEAEEKARQEAEEKARQARIAEEKARQERLAAEERARQEWIAEERARLEAEERARLAAEERARQERIAAERARLDAAERARLDAEVVAKATALLERSAARIAAEKARLAPVYKEIADNMVKVEAGRFDTERERSTDGNKIRVTLTKAYWIGKYEVTQKQYEAVMGNNPSKFKGDNRPVECVNWHDAKTFCDKLNELYRDKLPAGYRFDLPTETQWEFAARGGNKSKGYEYSGSNDIAKAAWYLDNSGKQTHDVGKKRPNELGLYDMSGNVEEWCRDWYGDYSKDTVTDPTGPQNGGGRVVRGGSWREYAYHCRVARRDDCITINEDSSIGFRLALVPID